MELEAENVKNIRSLALCKELLRQAIEQNDQLNEELRHQKYKRCMAMAQVLEHVCPITNRKAKWRDKWHNRWLKIAEKFKETKRWVM